jgi:tRNA uridine 5-carboxymethylaminomethyl modification enzyme
MFTSRAEFRLHLRIDNADRRLTPYGRRVGLITDAAWEDFLAKQVRAEKLTAFLEKTRGTIPAELAERLEGSVAGATFGQLLRRPEVTIEDLVPVLRAAMPELFGNRDISTELSSRASAKELAAERESRNSFQTEAIDQDHKADSYDFSPAAHARASAVAHSEQPLPAALPVFDVRPGSASDATRSRHGLSADVWNELKSVETEVKYSGYLLQQQRAIERLKKAEQRTIPDWFDYSTVSGLSREMNEKLSRVRPRTIGQALGIPGVTPAAVSLIHVYIEIQGRKAAARS